MTVNIDSADVRIIPECSERIVVTEANPGYSDAGVSRDRAITVTFSKKPSKSSFIFSESEIPADATNKKAVFDDEKNEVPGEFWAYTLGGQTYLKNISITNSDGISLAEHFLQPELDGNILTVPVDRSNSIEIESGSSLTIVVTISDGICDDNGVTMNGEKQWRYRATEATDEKATLTLSCENDEGSVYLAGTRDYNISQKITLSFTENADYQFLCWNYDSKIVNIAEPDKINTTAIVVEKTDASEIKAVCAKRLRVSSFSPKIDDKTPTVSKNSSIIITFDHDLPTDAEGYAQLSNISIAVGGSPVKSSFLEPVINGSSVTFAADKTNMLEVPGDQTKTVTVSVPADFFYKTDDGAKVTFGGNGEVFNYKIDSTTLEKAEITFGAAKDSGAITPSAGTYHYSIGSEIPLSFALSAGWQFNGWSVSGADQNVADKIKIADEKALSTKISVYEALQGVTVTAKTSECLRVTETSPSEKTNPKDSSIIITFNKPLAGDCSSLLNKIRVSSDGNSLDSYYTDRSISEISGDNGDFKQITIKNTSYLSVPKNSTKIITVTVPSDFYYNDGETKINLAEDSFSFTIDHTTEAKTGITYKVVNGEDGSSLSAGTINRSSYEEYNIGEEVELALDLYSGYQFYGWDITDSYGYSVTDQISYVNSNSSYLAPTLSINKSADGITVSAICYKCPTISTSSVVPYSSNSAEEVAKNTPIVLTFDHAISAETKDEIIVTYSAISNFNKDSYFSTSISNDNKTVTLTPIKMLPLEHAYETVTVTVPCQKVYYLASDGRTKITPADKDFSWSYRVNNSTLTKTVVRFATNDASVTGRQINAAGTLLSSGTKQDMNVEQAVNLEFPVADGYKFAGWKVESATTGYTVEPEGYVTSGTIIVKNDDKSYFTLVIDGTNPAKSVITSNDAIGNGTDGYGITVLAKDVLLPKITNFAPSSENINPKDSTITITFNKNLAESCSASLDLIKITMNGNDVSGFFEKRELKNNVITIKNSSLLDVTGSATKKITVTVPAVFYYEPEEGFRAYLSKEQSFDYKIDSSTANKTKIRFDSSENSKKTLKVNEASTNDGGTLAYNRGETAKLEYEVPAGYKFAGWKIVSPSTDYTVSPSDYVTSGTITVKNGDDTYLTLKVDSDNPSKAVAEIVDAIEDYETSGYGIKVLAKDVVLPVVTNFTPSESINAKDSKITLTFNKSLSTKCNTSTVLNKIKIEMDGSNVNSFFENRSLSGNTITIKNTDLLDVPGNKTKTITVTVPANIFYYEDGNMSVYLNEETTFNYKVDSSTINKTNIRFDLSEGSKNTLKVNEVSTNAGGTGTYNRGDTVKLEYEVSAGYKFAGWKIISDSSDYTVSTSSYITSGTITVKNGDNTYLTLKVDAENPEKAVVEAIKAIDDGEDGYGIKVLAKDVVLPVVNSVKINNTTSIYAVTSTSCDSKIYINFSKPIDTTTATLSSSGSITITKAGISSSHYESYFTASWSSDKKQLILTSKSTIAELVPNTSDTFVFVIMLNANRKEIKDSDACALILSESINNSFEVPYTINGVRETTSPEWYSSSSSQYLYSDNTSSKKTLSTTAFSSWSSAATGSYKNGTYSQNHVGNSVYYTMYGYDMDSGVKALRITETYYRSDTGATVTSTPVVSEKTGNYYLSSYNGVYIYAGTYTFKTQTSGVIKLDFQLVDNAGNTSTSKTWYVIKDNSVKMDNIYPYVSDMRRPSNNTDSVTVTILNGEEQDKFYKNFWGDISVEFYWGYSTDSMTKLTPSSTTDNENKYNFSRKADKLTYMKLIATDEVGNTMTSYYHIPPMYGTGNFTIEDGRNGSKWFKVTPYNTSYYENIASSVGANKFCIGYFIIESGKTISWENALTYDCQDQSYAAFEDYGMQNGKTYYVYFYIAFEYAHGVKVFSSWSESYGKIVVGKDSNGDNTYTTSIVTTNNGTVSDGEYFNDPVYVNTTAVKGSGCYTVDVDLTKSTNVKNGLKNYWYSMMATNDTTGEVFCNDGTSINLPSPGQYHLYMIVRDSGGKTKKSSWLYCYVNGSSSYNTNYSLKFTDDLTPPDMGYRYNDARDSAKYSTPTSLNLIYEEDTAASTKWSHNYPVDADNSVNSTIYYYILPGGITYCDDSVLAGHTRKKWTFNTSQITWSLPHASSKRQGIITLPYGDIDEGSYTVCVIAKDTNGNEVRRFIPVSNRLANEKLNWSYNRSTKKITPANTCSLYYYDTTHSRWIYVDETNAYEHWCRIIGYDYDKGYYNVEYAYLGTQYTCSNKNIMELQNGLQVFCDKTTFVHTLYSTKKLTEKNTASDIAVWETKGLETGVKITSSNFTYGSENLTGVPSGCYYTTVVHFMDGTTLMSEVKQK